MPALPENLLRVAGAQLREEDARLAADFAARQAARYLASVYGVPMADIEPELLDRVLMRYVNLYERAIAVADLPRDERMLAMMGRPEAK